MSRRLPLLCCLGLLLAGPVVPGRAPAQEVQRCIDASGRTIYTDQRCENLGATPRLPPVAISSVRAAPGRGPVPGGCPRNVSQLAGEVGAALRTGNSNRLSALYDWVGVSPPSAARVLERLERMSARPLVDIAPVLSAPPAPAPPVETGAPVTAAEPADDTGRRAAQTPPSPAARWLPRWISLDSDSRDGPDTPPATDTSLVASTAPMPAPAPPPRAVALRVEQTLPGSAAPASTTFGLKRRFGCLWLRL